MNVVTLLAPLYEIHPARRELLRNAVAVNLTHPARRKIIRLGRKRAKRVASASLRVAAEQLKPDRHRAFHRLAFRASIAEEVVPVLGLKLRLVRHVVEPLDVRQFRLLAAKPGEGERQHTRNDE